MPIKGQGDLYRRLQRETSRYDSGVFGTSYWDQYRNMLAGRDYLNGLYNAGEFGSNTRLYDKAMGQVNAGMASSAIGGGLAAMNGLLGIGQSAANNIKVNDVNPIYNNIGMLDYIAPDGYSNQDQISEDYARIEDLSRKNYNYDTIDGKTTGQKLANVGSATLSGALAGTQIAPGIGTAIGAGVGLLAGGIGWAVGDYKAKQAEENLDLNRAVRREQATRRAADAYEDWVDDDYNFRWAHYSAKGGKVNVGKELRSFSDEVDKLYGSHDKKNTGLVRRHTDEGTVIRFNK